MSIVKSILKLRRSKLFVTGLLVWVMYLVFLGPKPNDPIPVTTKQDKDLKALDDSIVESYFQEPEVPTLINFDVHIVVNYLKSFFLDQERALREKLKSYASYLKATDKEATKVKITKNSDYEIDNFNPQDYQIPIPMAYESKFYDRESDQDNLVNGLPLVVEYDIRFTLATYLNGLRRKFKERGSFEFDVPFHWYDWVDITQLNKYILFNNDEYLTSEDKAKYGCEYVSTNLVEEFGVHEKHYKRDVENQGEENQGEEEQDEPQGNALRPGEIRYEPDTFCRNQDRIKDLSVSYNQNINSSINFNVFKWTRKSSIRAKMLQSRSYLYSGAPTPVSIIFLVDKNFLEEAPSEKLNNVKNINEDQRFNGIVAYEVPIRQGNTVGNAKKLLESYDELVEPYLKELVDRDWNGDNVVVDPLAELKLLYKESPPDMQEVDPEETDHEIYVDGEDLTLRLSTNQFEYDYKEAMLDYKIRLKKADVKELRKSPRKLLKFNKESSHFDSLKFSEKKKVSGTKKYFHEVPIEPSHQINKRKSKAGGHYDWRFFNGIIDNEDETRRTLHHLFRSFFKFTYAKNIPVWAAHGSLLSWLWNGMNFPWDYDTDVQMPIKDLQTFCKLYNNTLIVENMNDGLGKYFVDCGSYLTQRTKDAGKNNIDARFIDIDKGIYIDITGLALSNAQLPRKFNNLRRDLSEVQESQNISFEANPSLGYPLIKKAIVPPKPISPGRIVKTYRDGLTDEQRFAKNARLQIYNCKNNHFIKYEQISPLRLTLIEGTKGFVPQMFEDVLKDEYGGHSLVSQYHANHFFLKKLRFWIPAEKFKLFFRKRINEDGDKHYRKALSKNMYGIDGDIVDILRFLEFDESVLKDYYLNQKITYQHEKEMEFARNGKSAKDVLLNNIEFKPILKDYFLHMKNDMERVDGEGEEQIYDAVKDSLQMNQMTGDEEEENENNDKDGQKEPKKEPEKESENV